MAFKTKDDPGVTALFKPEVPIQVGAMAVHHITASKVEHAPVFKGSSIAQELQQKLLGPDTILVAHNAKFDIDMLEKEGISVPRHICTRRVILWIDRSAKLESHSLQFLRYYFDVGVEAPAHDAMGDILVLEAVFDKLVNVILSHKTDWSYEDALNQFMHLSVNPFELNVVPMGVHKGKTFDLVPKSYLKWVIKEKVHSPDLVFTAKKWLNK